MIDEFDVGQLRHLETLAARAGDGDEGALSVLLSSVQPLVKRYCHTRLGPGASVHSGEDVAQEVCLALIGALPKYRNDGSSFLSFLYRIASHKVADAYRSMATSRRYLDVVEDVPERAWAGPEPEQAALESELARRMHGLVDRLPRSQQAVLVLRVTGGFSAPETARLLGSTPGAIRVAQHRALTSLREMLREEATPGVLAS
ncbi:RNA polymerase sigma factor ShbA [Actinomycetospora rhizophila]|uniref:RNA polymerase sigma factor ShbA n=1 Tax=Actinomycetospora rhizophila TaxID=1416876 RepID=A0ABV9ZN88_9PSEU